jgi:hypothetical protein
MSPCSNFHAQLSTGRGGLGNIRQSSTSRDTRPTAGPDDFSPTRGRELGIRGTDQVYATGRGGAGNMRSPSREVSDPSSPISEKEQKVIKDYLASHDAAPHSSGRGGLGNIDRSRSRDPHTPVHSTGRGGAGNIHTGHTISEAVDDEERKKLSVHHGGVHSTGRGGAANFTATTEPAVEHHHHKANPHESTGRGGVGNIHHTPPTGRD